VLVRTYIVDNRLSEIEIPDISQGFEQDILGLILYGSFDALGGTARNLSTLVRTGDCTLDINSAGAVVVSGHLGLEVIYLHWDHYDIDFQGLGISGGLAANVGKNSIFLQIEIVLTPNTTITLDEFRIEEADDIEIIITGLGVLDWLLSIVVTWVTDLFHDQIIGLIESQLRAVIEQMLPNIEIPFIS